jgi:hypothetical protein
VQVSAKEEDQTSVELYYKLQDGYRVSEVGEADADAAQQCHCVWAQDSSSPLAHHLAAGSEGGGHAPGERGGKVQDTTVSGKTGAAGQSEEEDSLFEEVLVQLLVSRQGEVFSCRSPFCFPSCVSCQKHKRPSPSVLPPSCDQIFVSHCLFSVSVCVGGSSKTFPRETLLRVSLSSSVLRSPLGILARLRSTPSSLPNNWNFKARPCARIYGRVAGEEVQRWATD